jgi:ADP-glucose pyrophosphorylase
MQAVILAGGKGTRLLPYTIVIPKPMLPIGGVPIIEIISRQLKFYGADEVIVSLGHLSELIKIYLESKKFELGMPEFTYHIETSPKGTAGPLKELSNLDDDFVVINGDILSNINIADLYDSHKKSGAVLTIAIRTTNYKLPLGMITVNGDNSVLKFDEKPEIEYLDNIGAYVYSTRALNYINHGEKVDVNILVEKLLKANEKVMAFRSEGPYYWIDIGTHADYEKANSEILAMSEKFPFLNGLDLS